MPAVTGTPGAAAGGLSAAAAGTAGPNCCGSSATAASARAANAAIASFFITRAFQTGGEVTGSYNRSELFLASPLSYGIRILPQARKNLADRGISSAAVPRHHRGRQKWKDPTMAAHDALRSILPVAGLPEDRARTVEITGGSDPVLPTPFRISETAAATLAATGLAVSDLWELRTGRQQQVAVDLRQATASLRSGHYLKMEKSEVSHERNPVMGMYRAKNGRWSY